MKTLVTGGTGFLGREIVRRLRERGDRVRVLARSFDPELAELDVEFVEGSLLDEDALHEAVDGVRRVFHLAGVVERDARRAHQMYTLHVDGTRRLLHRLVGREDIQKIVVASTSGVVGVSRDASFVANDASPYAEQVVRHWPYYLSKIYAERVCDEFVRDHGLPIVQMRPSLLLGPGDVRESSTTEVVQFLQRKIPTVLEGGLSFVDVRDTADAFIAAMQHAAPGEKYLIGGANMTLADFFGELERISGVRAPTLAIPGAAASAGARLWGSALRAAGVTPTVAPESVEMARHTWYVDWSRATKDLGFQPRDPATTLRDTVRWIERHHPDFAPKRPRPPGEFVRPDTVTWTEAERS